MTSDLVLILAAAAILAPFAFVLWRQK